MGEVISIRKNQPHIEGHAQCLACAAEWVAVAEIGVHEMECPSCRTLRGVWKGNPFPEQVWECECGSIHFFVSTNGAHCCRCGLTQVFG